jgi:hypothetical protein
MSILPKASAPISPRTKDAPLIGLAYAGIVTIFAVAQLFSFDKLPDMFDSFWLPGGAGFAHFLVSLLVIVEVFSLPFLLRIRVSLAMRFFSMLCGWLVAGIWLYVSLWLAVSTNAIDNIGILGTIVKLAPGWWAVLVSLGLGILAAWSSWGMWPLKTRK